MGLLDKLMPDGFDPEDIKKRADEAKVTQDLILAELRKLNAQASLIGHVANAWWEREMRKEAAPKGPPY